MGEHHQLRVSNLYIAQVKQKYGIIERESYHKTKNENPYAGMTVEEFKKVMENTPLQAV